MMLGLISIQGKPLSRAKLNQVDGKLKAVFFDYWETIVEETEQGLARMERIGQELCDFEAFRRIDRKQLEEALERRWRSVSVLLANQPFEVPLPSFFQGLLEDLALTSFGEEILDRMVSFVAQKIHERSILIPGALDFLKFLKEKGLKIGLISNTQFPQKYVEESMKKLGLLPYFDVLVLSSEVSWRKPYPEIFREGLRKLNVRPENAIHFGDSLYYDVEGAKKAGILPVQVLASRFRPSEQGEIAIYDWHAARALFSRLLG
jgi:HAD superfamily hydrolase (TIGR01549 family)